jgi:hypothetical protein
MYVYICIYICIRLPSQSVQLEWMLSKIVENLEPDQWKLPLGFNFHLDFSTRLETKGRDLHYEGNLEQHCI